MKEIKPAGYSDKSLSTKLGLRSGMNACAIHAPSDYLSWLGDGAKIIKPRSKAPWDFVHLFVNEISVLEDQLHLLRSQIKPDGMVWVSWYKKISKKNTELNED